MTVNKAAASQPVTLTRSPTYTLRFTGRTGGCGHHRLPSGGRRPDRQRRRSYTLAAETYAYAVKLKGYRTFKGEIAIAKDETIAVTMTPNAPWNGAEADAYDGGTGTKDDPYQIATGEQLRHLAVQTGSGGGQFQFLFCPDGGHRPRRPGLCPHRLQRCELQGNL